MTDRACKNEMRVLNKLIKRRRTNGQIKRREEGRKEETSQDGKGEERRKENEEIRCVIHCGNLPLTGYCI